MSPRTCTGCGRPMRARTAPDNGMVIHQARGLCSACYNAANPHFRTNRRDRQRISDEERERRRAAARAATVERRRQRLAALATPEPIEPGWEERADCLTIGAHVFEDPEHTRAAKNICADCPVKRSCLEAAMTEEHGQPAAYRAGIRGGLTPAERTSLDRHRRKETTAA